MKRKGNLYQDICKYENIENAFDEVCRNTKNKNKVARFILYPAIMPCLLDVNVASRKNLGTSEGLRLTHKFNKICKIRYENYYILKYPQ